MPAGVVGIRATGEVTADDYRRVLIPALDAAAADGGKIRLVYELGEAFGGFAAGGMWQDLRLGLSHFDAFERIALLTDKQWLHDGARLFSALMPGAVRVYGLDQRDAAVGWAAGQP
jgi:hypothetical protein